MILQCESGDIVSVIWATEPASHCQTDKVWTFFFFYCLEYCSPPNGDLCQKASGCLGKVHDRRTEEQAEQI